MNRALYTLAPLIAWTGCLTSREDFQDMLAMVADEDQDGFLAREDCDDHDALVRPDQDEHPYDGIDNDCNPNTPDDDLDGDGASLAVDCNDGDPFTFDGAAERCDSIDNDCDARTDEGALGEYFYDADGDGFGDASLSIEACGETSTHVANGDDCDDGDSDVNPGAVEVCGDGLDNDCSGDNHDCRWIGETSLGEALARVEGLDHMGRAGAQADFADVTGDGVSDLLVSAGFDDGGGERAGAVFLFTAPVERLDDVASASLVVRGDDAQQNLGRQALLTRSLGGRLIASAPGYQEGSASGAVFVFDPTQAGEIGPADALVEFLGEDVLGGVLALVEDESTAYLLASEAAGGDGRVLLLDLSDEGSRWPADAVSQWSGDVGAGLGSGLLGTDLDGDGVADLVLGASGEDRVYMLLAGELSLPDALVMDGPAQSQVGRGVYAGDINADGAPDLLLTAPQSADNAGAAWIVEGPFLADRILDTDAVAAFSGADAGIQWSSGATMASDLDGDGFDDLALGAPDSNEGGFVSIYFGPLAGSLGPDDADATLLAESGGDDLGFSLKGGVQLDGGGAEDLLIGAPSFGGAGELPGATYLWLGRGM